MRFLLLITVLLFSAVFSLPYRNPSTDNDGNFTDDSMEDESSESGVENVKDLNLYDGNDEENEMVKRSSDYPFGIPCGCHEENEHSNEYHSKYSEEIDPDLLYAKRNKREATVDSANGVGVDETATNARKTRKASSSEEKNNDTNEKDKNSSEENSSEAKRSKRSIVVARKTRKASSSEEKNNDTNEKDKNSSEENSSEAKRRKRSNDDDNTSNGFNSIEDKFNVITVHNEGNDDNDDHEIVIALNTLEHMIKDKMSENSVEDYAQGCEVMEANAYDANETTYLEDQ